MSTQTYHIQIRERIVNARKEGHSAQVISQWFKVSKRSVERYWKQYQQTGDVLPKQRGGYRRSRLEGHEETFKEWIAQQPDLTLQELQARCREKLHIQIGISALWTRLDKLGYRLKKNAARQRAGT